MKNLQIGSSDRNNETAEVKSFEEITEPNIEYHLNDTDKWVRIELSDYSESNDEYFIAYRLYRHQNLTAFVTTNGDLIKTWKTFNGAKRYILRELADESNYTRILK